METPSRCQWHSLMPLPPAAVPSSRHSLLSSVSDSLSSNRHWTLRTDAICYAVIHIGGCVATHSLAVIIIIIKNHGLNAPWNLTFLWQSGPTRVSIVCKSSAPIYDVVNLLSVAYFVISVGPYTTRRNDTKSSLHICFRLKLYTASRVIILKSTVNGQGHQAS